MRHLRRLGVLGCALVLLVLGCGRTRSSGDDALEPGEDPAREDTGGAAGGAGRGAQQDDDGAQSGDVGTQDPAAGDDGRPSPGGTADPTSGSSDGASAGADSDDGAPSTSGSDGTATSPPSEDNPPPGMQGENPAALDVLNPNRCASEQPFVLSISPGGASGEVRGWLESTSNVVFDGSDLPRFGAGFGVGTEQDLVMWWSIATLDGDPSLGTGSSLWMYVDSAQTELAHVPVRSPAEIGDARELTFVARGPDLGNVGPVPLGEMVVYHHLPTDRFIALQAFDMYGTEDSDRRDICAAIDARWFVAPHGTGDFTGFE